MFAAIRRLSTATTVNTTTKGWTSDCNEDIPSAASAITNLNVCGTVHICRSALAICAEIGHASLVTSGDEVVSRAE